MIKKTTQDEPLLTTRPTNVPQLTDKSTSIARLFRMWPAWVVTFILLVIIYYLAPQQLGVIVYKAVFLTLGAVVGFWVHVWSLGFITDHLSIEDQQHAAWRRTVFIVGAMLAFSLAV